jgi:hypothetical protein
VQAMSAVCEAHMIPNKVLGLKLLITTTSNKTNNEEDPWQIPTKFLSKSAPIAKKVET